MRFLIFLVFLLAAQLQTASAEESSTDVRKLLNWCKSSQGSADLDVYVGYITGVVDLMGMVGASGTNDSKLLGTCGEKRLSYGASVQVFINWAERHPELATAPKVVGVAAAIREQSPCK